MGGSGLGKKQGKGGTMSVEGQTQMNQTVSPEMRNCIQDCQRCHNICLETVRHCLKEGGEHAKPGHIRLLLDCAEICQTSANFMLRTSDMHILTCGVCAEVCERCAEDCARFVDDIMMQGCAQACRKCAASCREMAGGAHH
jgi:hypothetical protein